MSDSLPVPPLRFPSSSLPRRVSGYDREATERLFEKLASSYEQLWLECSQLREQMSAFAAEVERFEEEKRLLASALVEVKESTVAIMEDARQEAEAMLRKARQRADETFARAEQEAQTRAERAVSEAKRERGRLQEEIARLRAFAAETHRELSSFLLTTLDRHAETVDADPLRAEAQSQSVPVGNRPAAV
jgi:cell division septum initiation protein DivIVA